MVNKSVREAATQLLPEKEGECEVKAQLCYEKNPAETYNFAQLKEKSNVVFMTMCEERNEGNYLRLVFEENYITPLVLS